MLKKKNSISKLRRIALRKPTKEQLFELRAIIILGVISMFIFLFWFFQPENRGSSWLYWMLTSALLFKLFRWLHEWFHYFSISYPEPPQLLEEKHWTVDMLTTYCKGEPYEMVIKTLKAMKAVTYPHTTYLCDEADDSYLKKICDTLGVVHVTRQVKIDAKAGNINNALKQATGEITVILDPDHIPYPNFLNVVLPYFNNDKIGFVQVVQAYYNHEESKVARGAAEQTYQFYGPLMMGMNSYGTAQAIGANCTFRRAALDSIGGHAPGLAEDMHTSMLLHAAGWESVYVPEVVARGLVPSSISAYYSQQLKWSRGTFDLLVNVLPKIFTKLKWKQKFHYFILPFHYLNGFVTLFDILIPVLALLLAKPVWKTSLPDFMLLFLPLLIMALLIRVYSQRWLASKEERGLHLTGGVLRMGTWWIYIMGFVLTIFRKKIPYIPTPKDNEILNEWKHSLINFIAGIICLVAIPIGLIKDWSPYSIFMAAFSLINALCLLYVCWIGQQHLITYIKHSIAIGKSFYKFADNIKHTLHRSYLFTTKFLCKRAIVFALLAFIFVSGNGYRIQLSNPVLNEAEISAPAEKKTGGFYTGIFIPDVEDQNSLTPVLNIEKLINNKFEIVSLYQSWGPKSLEHFPIELLRKIRKNGSIPMITWEPYSHNFPELSSDKNLSVDWRVFDGILSGKLDKYIMAYALKIRDFGEPVMIRFAHEMDNPAYPWSFYGGGNTPDEYIHAHQYVVKFFNKMGATNVTWVWNPWEEDAVEKYYPGNDFVDWIGVTNLNYGLANSSGKWVGFEDLYKPFHDRIMAFNKPVMLSEFGSTNYGGARAEWFKDAFEKIQTTYTEIKSVVLFYHNDDKNWGATKWRPSDGSKGINWTFKNDYNSVSTLKTILNQEPFNQKPSLKTKTLFDETSTVQYKSPFIRNSYPDFELVVDSQPFFIKGVAYNVGEDWRDGNIPLTRSRLEDDFTLIKEMGANTVRRYATSMYDYNVLNVAEEKKLKVLFGFWFESKINYLTDDKKKQEYEEEVLNTVREYKDRSAILGWNLGNEVWGLLKQYYQQPYLTIVRNEYARFLEDLAKKIHAIDPAHPVFAVGENSKHLPGEFYGLHVLSPSIDVFGINSYYEDQISILQNIQYIADTTRPYLISEYGPQGYWDSYFSRFDENNRLIEDAGSVKAKLYQDRWDKYIEGKKGMNVGGIAYTWQDRMEGTFTWFGLMDYKSRLKPAYFALKNKWTGDSSVTNFKDVYIYSPKDKLKPGAKCTFYAISEELKTSNQHYEWLLCSDDFVIYKTHFILEDNDRRVSFTIPEGKKGLRLYLFVADENNNRVNTASIPVLK